MRTSVWSYCKPKEDQALTVSNLDVSHLYRPCVGPACDTYLLLSRSAVTRSNAELGNKMDNSHEVRS